MAVQGHRKNGGVFFQILSPSDNCNITRIKNLVWTDLNSKVESPSWAVATPRCFIIYRVVKFWDVYLGQNFKIFGFEFRLNKSLVAAFPLHTDWEFSPRFSGSGCSDPAANMAAASYSIWISGSMFNSFARTFIRQNWFLLSVLLPWAAAL